MGFQDDIGIAGRVHIQLREPGGRLIDERRVHNLVTLEGRALLGRCFSGLATLGGRLELAIGTGSNKETLEDLALGAEIERATAASPELLVTGDGVARRSAVRVRAIFPVRTGEPQPITEAGIWVGQVGAKPVLFNRTTFPVITRSEHLELALAWEVLF